jgi:hypothetical protein
MKHNFGNWIPLICPKELDIKEISETTSSVSLLDIYLNFDTNGQLSTRLCDKEAIFNDDIINCSYLESMNYL